MSLPITELWSKFQAAIRFTQGVLSAGVAVIQAAPAIPAAEKKLLDAASATGSAPTTASQGASIEGLRTVNLYAWSAGGNVAVTVKLWLYTGFRWVALTSLDLDQDTGALDALDTEGYQRLFAQVTAYTGPGNLSLAVFPYNVETP